MTPEQITSAGLRERVVTAQKRVSAAISSALRVLNEFNVTTEDLTEVIDRRIAETAHITRKALKD
jgi:hypothetical protein